MVFDTLYGLDASLTPQPQMAEGHELSGDRITWRFTLREGLWFHDGEPVRARDAVASIGRWAQGAPLGVRMKTQLDEMRAIDDRLFEIQLKKPFPHLLYGLGRAADCVIRPERVAGHIDAFTDAEDYTGSGPFSTCRMNGCRARGSRSVETSTTCRGRKSHRYGPEARS